MVKRAREARRRRWADIVVIVVGVYEFMIALWGAGLAQPRGLAFDVALLGWYWAATAIAGTLSIAAVLVALKRPGMAKAMVVTAGVVLLSALFALDRIDLRAVINLVIPALLLFGTAPFMGPMPTPEEEGRRR